MGETRDQQCYRKSIEWDLSCGVEQALQLVEGHPFKRKPLSFRYLLESRSYVSEVHGTRFRLWGKSSRGMLLAVANGEIHSQGLTCHLSANLAVNRFLTLLPLGFMALVTGIVFSGVVLAACVFLAASGDTYLAAICLVLYFVLVFVAAYGGLRIEAQSQMKELERLLGTVYGEFRLQDQSAPDVAGQSSQSDANGWHMQDSQG